MKKILLLFIAIFSFSFLDYAQVTVSHNTINVTSGGYFPDYDFNPSYDISFESFLNKGTKNVKFRVLLFDTKPGDYDDLWTLETFLNNEKILKLQDNNYTLRVDTVRAFVTNNPFPYPFNLDLIKLMGVEYIYPGINLNNMIVTPGLNRPGDNRFITIDVEMPIPNHLRYENQYTYGPGYMYFEDEGGDAVVSGYNDPYWLNNNVNKSLTGWGNVNLSQALTATAGCGNVALAWNIQNNDSVELSSMRSRIYKDGVLIHTQNCSSGNNTYSVSVGSDINDHNYVVKVSYAIDQDNQATLNKREESTNEVTVSAIPPLAAPFGFEATDNRCDGKIRLTWSWNQSAPDNFEIDVFNGSTFVTTIGSISGSSNSFIYTAPNKNVNYTFYIYAKANSNTGSQCIGRGISSFDEGIALDKPLPPSNLVVTQLPGTTQMELNWQDNSNAPSNEDNFRYIRSSATSNVEYSIPSDQNTYIDEFCSVCVAYSFTIRSENTCGFSNSVSVSSQLQPAALGSTFNGHQLNASKGYFSNKVEMSWNLNNANQLTDILLLRKLLTDPDNAFVEMILIDPAIKFYIDNTTDAGVLYEYALVGRSNCGAQVFYSDTTRSTGFRSPFGTITGQVNYTGGIAVKNVKIQAESSQGVFGNSLQFSGAQNLEINHNSNLNPSNNELTAEFWFKPTSHASNFTLVEKQKTFSVKHIGSNYVFEVFTSPTTSKIVSVSDASVNLNQYNQFTATVFNDTLKLYLSGISSTSTLLGGTINIDTNKITLGNNYTGLLDEFRYWNVGKDTLTAKQDFSRAMSGAETGLKVYIRMNETIGDYAYDFSHIGLSYNKNHAKFIGSILWSSSIPSSSQLSIAAYTNQLGNYILVIPYTGIGETFTLTPSFLVHQFNPSTRALFLGESSFIHNNIDFTDISSFTVQGDLFYANTSCAVEGASLKIDGNIVVANGLPVLTDAAGQFNIQVPIGKHFITIEKNGHVMNKGRMPDVGTYDFQDDFAGIHFEDTTLVKMVGRVVGGLREAQYIPGLGRSKNNIGTARITLTSTQGNGCYTKTLYTDASSGEYITYVPPLIYNPTVTIPSNSTLNFGVLDQLDLFTIPTLKTAYDTLGYDTLNQVFFIDSISYHKQNDYIHRVNAQIEVKGGNVLTEFIGDTLIEQIDKNSGDTILINLKTNPMDWPVFSEKHAADEDYMYTCNILVFESYENYDNNNLILDSVPVTDGKLYFSNEIAISANPIIELNEFNSLDSLKYIAYKFKVGKPNMNDNFNIPKYSFTKKFGLYLESTNGTITHWLPVTNIPLGGDGFYRAIVLGAQSTGGQFTTNGPETVDYILRDPPGSGSYSVREQGSSITSSESYGYSLGLVTSATDGLDLGSKTITGIGVATINESTTNFTVGLETSISGGSSNSISNTSTTTQAWQTNSNTDQVGAGSDLFIGTSKNMSFGISTFLTLIPDSLCQYYDCVGAAQANSNYRLAKTNSISMVPQGYATAFIYDANHIESYLIPTLKTARNAFLQGDSRYVSNLPNTDPNYGLSNDNSIFGSSASPNESEYYYVDDHNGPSYNYTALNMADSLKDDVRFLNQQIRIWEGTLEKNEFEKVVLGDQQKLDSLKTLEISRVREQYTQLELIAMDSLLGYFTNNNQQGGIDGVLSGIKASLVSVVPLPGTTILGTATFFASLGVDLLQEKLLERTKEYQAKIDRINLNFSNASSHTNHSINGGVVFTNTVQTDIVSSSEDSYEYGISPSFSANLDVNIAGIGFSVGRSITGNYSRSNSYSDENSISNSISYVLNDPDQGDYFSVDVFQSIYGWGPIFKLQQGGQTSCPFEDEIVTKYYNPGTVISEATLQRDKATISASPSILTNVPISDAAVFNLTINNMSESSDTREYTVAVNAISNPYGAIVKIDGFQPFANVVIPGTSSINKVITIEKGPGSTYNYDSIMVLVYAPCQFAAGSTDNEDLVDTTYISAHFLPTCTEVNFSTPDDLWVLNNSFNDTMPIAAIDYNINFYDFNSIRLDYKPASQAQWIGLQTFYKDTTGLNNPAALKIPTSTPFTLWNWQTDQVVDGSYDLRMVTQCTLADKISVIHRGLMDRINPHPFGTPSPADGILDPNDDISIKFNEPIDLGSITSQNFDVRGIINGTETNHASNLYFDGINDYVEVTAGLPIQNRDFTIEFSVKRAGTGAECILSQGDDSNEQLFIGFNAADQLEVKFNNVAVTSANTFVDNEWHYFSVTYSFQNETLDIFEASGISTASSINTGNNSLPENYSGISKMYIGKDGAGNVASFNGNLDDFRVWNKTRTVSQFSVTKSKLLAASELGLLYNWRFDDADGNFATDHVRKRDGVIYGAEWTIEPQGNAVSFDGVDDYLKISNGTVNISDEMDFTLEFWFNSAQPGAATLVSNGTGTGLSADSIYSWNIAKDAAGLIHVNHNGLDFVATNTNYFDGEWHHFALVLNRSANLTSYVDGNLENSVQSVPFGGIGGNGLYLGSRGYYSGNVETFDSPFAGQLDEFRLWSASRTFEQIARDKQNRMKGNEMGLIIYLPFENYTLTTTGIPILTSSFDEQIFNNLVVNPNGAIINNTPPKIKLQRPTQSIAFTYSVNNDQIIITPTTSSQLIENVTLDVTVKGIKDLHGNIMQSPKTWIAYMDKNQVVWQDDAFVFEKDFGAPLTFTSAVVNTGGATKAFTISNLPSWLTASQTTGSIAPNSTVPITFTVNANVNIGNYLDDVSLTTDFGFAEKLTIDLKVRAEEPAWTVTPSNFTNSMSIIGYIKINNVVSATEEDMLSVFVDDECRGVAHLEYVPLIDRYLVFLDVYSNLNNGENLSFKVWDASAGTIFSDILPSNLTFVANGLIGSVVAPQLFETSYEIEVALPLHVGWNWVSNFLMNPDSLNLDLTLESLESVTGNEIKGISSFSNYLENTGWVGSLNNSGIVPEDGYKLKVSQLDTLVIKGDIINPISRTINLEQGWNWLGFISIRNQSIAQALGNLNPSNGDIIKAQSQFAVYDNVLGWVGSLQTMKPGTGYMYNTSIANNFVFPEIGQFKFAIADKNEIYKNKKWAVSNNEFASNMTIISALDTDCDYILESKDLVIGVFDENANCRAVNEIQLLNENMYSFLTVGGATTTDLKFGIMDTKTGRSYDLDEEVAYVSNSRIGTVNEPMRLKISDEICFKIQLDKTSIQEDDIASESKETIEVYPTLFENQINLYYLSKTEGSVSSVRLYNLWGQLVYENVFSDQKGFNKISFDLSKNPLPTGVYHFIVEDENAKLHSFKIIKK